jgi:hypothetical protein
MPHKLNGVLADVPPDIEISQSVRPISIERIASNAGILT